MKVNLEVVKKGLSTAMEYIKPVGAIVIPVVVISVADKGVNRIMNKIRYGNVGYDDAVRAILNSGMFSDAKQRAIAALKTDGDSEYYRAVIYVVESSMFSDAKVETIEGFNK